MNETLAPHVDWSCRQLWEKEEKEEEEKEKEEEERQQ
jgi:hypothetical protein